MGLDDGAVGLAVSKYLSSAKFKKDVIKNKLSKNNDLKPYVVGRLSEYICYSHH